MARISRTPRSSPRRPSSAKSSKAPASVEAALAAFAHEVRTPLTGILAISDLLATSDLGERERRWVDTIKAGAEHLSGLATLFVDAARSRSASGLPIRDEPFDLRALALSAGDSLAGRAAAKGLASKIEIAKRLPVHVSGDAIRLRAALENLVDNAVKFTDSGRVALKVRQDRQAKRSREHDLIISFALSDSGIGLSVSEIKRLFKPFSQANASIASRFGGAGLGLSSVRALARAMGGDIKVESRRGGGATFLLTVGLKSAVPTKQEGAAGAVPARRPLKILSVEDNPFGRVVLNAILTELGHHAEFVGRGEEAAARVANGAFDAVLMDMVLPGIDGIKAIRHIRRLKKPFRQIPIVGVSGRGDDEVAARKAGAGAFVIKPISPAALEAALLEATRLSEGAL
jgi:CheY-like chemotaxis protein